jgi:hypothetical protein
MRVPRWIWLSLIPLVMTIAGDRMHTEGRISRLEESKADVVQRLDRIEKKLDHWMEQNAR